MLDIIYPLDDKVIKRCKDEMDINAHKGNSWTDETIVSTPYLLNKLQEEYAEFVLSITDEHQNTFVEGEGADLINIIAMLMQRFRK